MKQPLVAVLKTTNPKTNQLEIVREVNLPLESFPDMIEMETPRSIPPSATVAGLDGLPGPKRQFFRIGITDRTGFYREGTSLRI